ncbi:uncharacterized protein LOC119506076 [Choloepus didactylus]|uniref:uncharacterized protein LOC119506076 n=1 Tax=Choloepus didactylus TaxID=27675 RepID=UPI0018A0EB68|nr:uncharacterized protein LOC119506076 [Choloepus didactylus]
MSGCCDAGEAGLGRGSRGRGWIARSGLRGGIQAKWGRGPRANAPPPTPVRACPPGNKPLGGGDAFKTKKCGVEQEGLDPGGGERPLRCRCSAPRPEPRILGSGGRTRGRESQVSRNAQSAKNLPGSPRDSHRKPAASAPPSRSLSPLGPGGRPARADPENLRRFSLPPRRLCRDTPLSLGFSRLRWVSYPGSVFTKHTFVSTHATGARAHTPTDSRARSPAGSRRRDPGHSAAPGGRRQL